MEKLPNLIWLRSFDAAARHLNFTEAAKELGMTQTAVSLHIRSLEATLRCKLFTRAARKLALTELGLAYAMTMRSALAEIALSTTSLFGAGQSQILTVRIPISTATLWLVQRLPKFTRLYPNISIRLMSNIWAESAGYENVDVELRFGTGSWPGHAAHQVSTESMVQIAAASDMSDLSPEKISEGPIVQILGHEDSWGRHLNAQEQAATYTVDTTIAAIGIVAAGGGYAVILERFARTAIACGHTIKMVGDPVPLEQAHYLLRTSGSAANSTTNSTAKQLFENWLEKEFAS